MADLIGNEKLVIDAQKRLSMTEVENVIGFSENFILLTIKGKTVKILGENIKITSFNKGNGSLCADGIFYEIKYNYKKQPFIKKILK